MPYCPKCDMEFVEGITVCSDCGGPLIKSKEEALALQEKVREEAMARQLEEYENLRLALEEEKKARPDEAPDIPDGKASAPVPEPTHVYVKKSQKYEDLRSSASAFLVVGGILLVFSVLCWANVIPLPMAGMSRIISQSAMTAFAVISLGIAASSFRSAKTVKGQVASEEKTTRQLVDWFLGEYTGSQLDEQLAGDYGDLNAEELSLKRFDLIQDILITHHDLADPSYVDLLAEEIYGKLFEE